MFSDEFVTLILKKGVIKRQHIQYANPYQISSVKRYCKSLHLKSLQRYKSSKLGVQKESDTMAPKDNRFDCPWVTQV